MANNRNEKLLLRFGKNLKKFRTERGLTTREFAERAEIAHSQVWTLESGKGDPSLSTLMVLSKVLNVTVEQLIE